VQVLVYAGAIMVLFIFVIMLLNIREATPAAWGQLTARGGIGLGVAGVAGVAFIAALDGVVHSPPAGVDPDYGTIAAIGDALFNGTYLLPFEAVSLLLTVGMIGAVVLAKREL
jgi:NADH-quinone oxidoreductase subunit J